MEPDLSEKEQAYNKALELKNSTVLNLYKISNYQEFVPVVDHLYDEMVNNFGLNFTLPSSIKKFRHHIEIFVLNLYKVYRKDHTKVISYSRDSVAYSGKKSRLKNKFGLSYWYSVEKGSGAINFLNDLGYIECFGFQHDKNNPANSYRSRMRATKKLIDLIENQYGISEDKITRDYSKDEIIILKGLKPKPTSVYVVRNGKRKKETIQRKRKICKTPDTPNVRKLRENLELINNVMEEADITLDITDEELRGLNERLNNDSNPYKEAIDFSRKQLHRVFLDGRRKLDRGGRFYGAWYQNLPKEYRNRILINGVPTYEADFSSLHPNLLYAIKKATPPDGDLYELDTYSEETRKFLKGFFLRIINATSREGGRMGTPMILCFLFKI